MAVVLIVIYLFVVFLSLIKPIHSNMSVFELERRVSKGNKTAKDVLKRERLLPGVGVFKNFLLLILSLVFVWVSVSSYGLSMTLLLVALAFISLGPISKVKVLMKISNKIYNKIEAPVLKIVDKCFPILEFFEDISSDIDKKTSSTEELVHVVSSMDDEVLGKDKKTIILSALKFGDRLVKDVMVPKEKVVFVDKSELLGPLVLDKLHKTGFGYFPVMNGDVNHIEGMLKVTSLLSIDTKQSPKVEKVMTKKAYFVRDDYDLEYALSAFMRVKYHFFVVINEERETVGILTLRDLMQSLLGKDLWHDVDGDDDIVTVSKRKPNNNAKSGVDV